MNNKFFAILVLCIEITICSLITMLFYINMANDLSKKTTELEQEIIQLKWENKNNYMYCSNE